MATHSRGFHINKKIAELENFFGNYAKGSNFIRTNICDKYSESIKISARLDHISHYRTTPGTI
jgi:hypothetical protein